MLRILATLAGVILSGFSANPASARVANIKVEKIESAVVSLDGVRMRVAWPEGAAYGTLDMHVDRVQAPSIAGDYKTVHWRCRLARVGWKTWRCAGPIALPGSASADFSVDFRPAGLDVGLRHGRTEISLQRRARAPELTLIELQALPLAWAKAFIARSWSNGRFDKGELSGRLSLHTNGTGVRVDGPLALSGAALRMNDDSLIAENLAIAGTLDYANTRGATSVSLEGTVLGDMLAGTTFVSLQGTPARFELDANANNGGWRFSRLRWTDGATLVATGSLDWTSNGVRNVAIQFESRDARQLKDRYLSGWLAPLGLSSVELTGGLNGRVESHGQEALSYVINPQGLNLNRPDGQFNFAGLNGGIAISQGKAVESRLSWRQATLYGLNFGAGDLPFVSQGGEIALREPASIPVFNGKLRFDTLRIRPPQGDRGLGLQFALGVEHVDFGAMSQAVGLPAFRGELNGAIPTAVYENDLLRLDGGLNLDVFEGRVTFSSLSIERPFGTAPTLVANLDLDRLDLLRLTEVFGFGSITGKLSGSIHDLRLIEWSPVRFDAELHTVKTPGVKQRISQRAVKNISSVGGSSPTSGLQAKALELFKDFGYSRIGLSCKLVNSVCMMSGLAPDSTSGSGSNSFTILQGAGIPRLTVVGHNRLVDWPVLVERVKAVAEGDVKPVIEH
ncbi:hypothetical protein [Lysobacter soyae]|uniref:C4-dicarboxylate ABC transporter n=1 Tax=Lysobacter soyae TaxID=2764185 RepID=A0ABX8WN08_9GAMM|nr:hypothetical protein [Lysobacter sp. CJ11]QYR52206.1 hypothetical protein H8L67_06180 [Lysobacter sp. CJ11]